MEALKESFSCSGCGALLKFNPGTSSLECPYCKQEQQIEESKEVEEYDYREQLEELEDIEESLNGNFVKCSGCGATVTVEKELISSECPYCSNSLINSDAGRLKAPKPGALIPFTIGRGAAGNKFKKWINSLWFAPSDLKKRGKTVKLKGVYIPYWTFDSDTSTLYTGRRGDYYYTTESYTSTNSEGKTEVRQRQVRHTRWSSASGTVPLVFDDLMVPGGTTLPAKYVAKLTPWHLEAMVNFDESFLQGFSSEACSKGLKKSFEEAKGFMKTHIRRAVKKSIGGDQQIIESLSSDFSNIKFRHLLVPTWVSSYPYKGKVYRFLINGQTGEVQGERPWSITKIVSSILIAVLLIGGVILLFN